MERGKIWISVALLLGTAPLAWGAGQQAPATPALPKVAVKPSPPGTQKTAYQRRQEAKKHLQEALANRNALRSAGSTPAGSGGAQ